jgi:hypothetical protein
MQNLAPDHLADLRKSGLSDETIKASGIACVTPRDIRKRLGYDPPSLKSMYEIPYGDGFSRFRCFYEEGKTDPKYQKYFQKKDSGNRLYIPPLAASIFGDATIPLYITEGEKKALKACQEGLHCVGLGGLWNWKIKGGGLIPDFDKIALEGRKVYLIPDNDFKKPNKHGYKKNLAQAVNQLAYALIERGATVFIVELPEGQAKGLDDFLCEYSTDDFHRLPSKEVRVLTLDEKIKEATVDDLDEILEQVARIRSKVKQEAIVNLIVQKLKVSKSAVKKDLKRHIHCCESDESGKNVGRKIALFPSLVDLVDDGGEVAFLIKDEAGLRVETSIEFDGVQYVPPEKEHLPFLLPKADQCLSYFQGDDSALFDDIVLYFHRFSYLSEECWLIIAIYVFQTYLQDHPDLHYMAMLLFYAVPERGKSRTGKAVSYLAYRGVHVVDMREANIFRYSGNLGASIFFDMMDLWKKAERNGCEDILLLRYEKGACVSRVLYPEKGAFEDTVYYPIHGPTIMASNEPVHKILGSRCIPFMMPNSPGNYENPTPELAADLKCRLVAWRARMMGRELPAVKPINGIDGRLWDITQPLFQICLAICPNRYNTLIDAVLEIAGQRTEEKKESFDGLIVQALQDCVKEDAAHYEIATADLTKRFNELWQGDKSKTEKWMGRRIKALMGKKADRSTGRSIIKLNHEELETLLMQYGFLNPKQPARNAENARNADMPMKLNAYPACVSSEEKGETQETQKNADGESKVISNGFALPALSAFQQGNHSSENLRDIEI